MVTVHEVFNDSININEYLHILPGSQVLGDDFPAKISWAGAVWLVLVVELMDQG